MLELQFDPAIQAHKIGVSVEDGIVTLSGFAERYTDKYAAEKRTFSIAGVRGVVEQIRVVPVANPAESDQMLAEASYEALKWNSLVPNSVHVAISSGIATLSGSVSWAFEKKAAIDTIRHLRGIVDVNCDISVEPNIKATDIQKRIERALVRAAGDDAKNIKVDVQGGEGQNQGSSQQRKRI
mgnify:CR=1 FL=1